MASETSQLHFLMIPLLSHSHLIPITDTAKLLAQRGMTVTIITTPLNATHYKNAIDNAVNSNLKVHLVEFQFPSGEAGLPQGCENLDSLPHLDLVKNFFEACHMLEKPLEDFLREFKPPANCIISSNALPWTLKVARRFNIPWMVYHTVSCFTLSHSYRILRNKVHGSIESESEPFEVDKPDGMVQLPATLRESLSHMSNLTEELHEAELFASGMVINSFEELEPIYVEDYKKMRHSNVWCIGPVSLCNKEMKDKLDRGNKTSINENECLKWLDTMKQRSVIYVCFGSLCNLTVPQLVEIGLGLEASNHPFIWIIREANYSEEFGKWISEEGLRERIQGRGVIIRGWAPQLLILSHPAVGGFLTHCGWNSVLEGVSAGLPMVTWPMFAEQFYNEEFIVQVLRIGVRIGNEVYMQWSEEKKIGVVMMREDIKKAIVKLMDEGEEGKKRRTRARELGAKANMAMEEGGSSYSNMTMLIQEIMQLFLST